MILNIEEENIGLLEENSTTGNVGIGTTSPSQKLHVVGDAYKSEGGTAWADSSDSRLKNELGDITNGLSLVENLRPIKYEWNDTRKKLMGEDPGVKFGFIAQEMINVLPELIPGKDANGYYNYNPSGIEAILVAAIKELKAQNDALELRLKALEGK